MMGKTILAWMHDEDRTVGHLARRSGIPADRLIELLAGAELTGDEALALANLTGMPVEELRDNSSVTESGRSADPLRCYTVAEASALLGVSPDTIRKEISQGTLAHVVLGQRSIRIPRRAIEERLSPPWNQPTRPAVDPAPPPQPQRSSPRAQARQLPLS